MKTKTRKIIGNILVWGGLIGMCLAFYRQYSFLSGTDGEIIFRNGYIFIGSVISILIGGLWGMRK